MHTTWLDDRHFNLLTPIVLVWLAWGLAAIWAEQRWGRGYLVIALAGVAVVAMAAIGLGLGALLWVIAAVLGARYGRGRR